jgi:hypothetical protein
MLNEQRIPEPWRSFLEDLDSAARDTMDFRCIGGFVITQQYGFVRQTADVDVLAIAPNQQLEHLLALAGKGSPLHRKYNVYLDFVAVIQCYPENYEQRLTEMFPGQLKKIRLLAPDACDLALMKLERNIERDREDVKYLARRGFLTAEDLERRYREEMRPYVAMPEQRMDPVLELWLEMIGEELEKMHAMWDGIRYGIRSAL